jgi:hypothetical protein
MGEWEVGPVKGLMHKFKGKDDKWSSIHFREDGDIYINDKAVVNDPVLAKGMMNLDKSYSWDKRLLINLVRASRELKLRPSALDIETLKPWRQALDACRDIDVDLTKPKTVLARPLFNAWHDLTAWGADCPHCWHYMFEDHDTRGIPEEDRPEKCDMCDTPIRIIYPWEIKVGMEIYE